MSEESTKKDRARRKSSEPTTSKNDKRPNLQAVQLLKNKHPELFEITPLAGHYHRHKDSRRSGNDNFDECESSESKVYPVLQFLIQIRKVFLSHLTNIYMTRS